jgi:hypothetical protein
MTMRVLLLMSRRLLLKILRSPATTCSRASRSRFLLALEALTPSQRAVLLLRDVFDYSTTEVATALEITETSAKVLLHRARGRMRDYDKERALPDAARSEATRRALEQFLLCLKNRDAEGLEKLLAKDAISISDGGGVRWLRLSVLSAGAIA